MYVCILYNVYIHTYTYKFTYTHTHTHIHIHIQISVHIHVHIHTQKPLRRQKLLRAACAISLSNAVKRNCHVVVLFLSNLLKQLS